MTQQLDRAHALETAVRAARAAGDLLVHAQRAARHDASVLGIRTKGAANDYVTEADSAAQAEIVRVLQGVFPEHRFLGEEGGTDDLGDPQSPFRWIIDPLDGTLPFIHGKPNFGTMIALEEDGHPVVGVIWRPLFDELCTAIRGEGAFCNGTRVRLRATSGMADAVLCTNIMHRSSRRQDGTVTARFPFCASIENYGNAAQEFSEILRGWNDGLFFDGPRLWDTSPGCLMVEEAGGKTRTELKDPQNHRSGVRCVASTAPIFGDLCRFVFGAEGAHHSTHAQHTGTTSVRRGDRRTVP